MPTNVFTFKKDYASQEKANNTLLTPLYSDTLKDVYMFPAQEENPKLRTGIWGKPIVIFNSVSGETPTFIGCYNYNLDKGSIENFGYDEENSDQCFEFLNNTDTLGKFKSTGSETLEDYKGSFEFRFPDIDTEEYTFEMFSDLKKLIDWVSSTDTTVEGLTEEEIVARLLEFKTNFGKWFVKDAVIHYYLFTLLCLSVDQRQKNMMLQHYGPITYSGGYPTEPQWFFAIYDSDTALGINNEGSWLEGNSYAYEDEDTLPDGGYVYNGHDSVLWHNLIQCFPDEIKAAYKTLRNSEKINYDYIDNLYDTHQSKWPERMWNEDAFYCYINPLQQQGTDNLRMLLGNKKLQRKYWLYNRFKYLDSKFQAGGSTSKAITLRSYAGDDAPNCKITLTPYVDLYGTINWANSAGSAKTQQQRMKNNQEYEFVCPQPTMNDQEIYIYSADQLTSIGDISRLQIDYCDFSAAKNLKEIIMGSTATGWQNTHAFDGFNIGSLPILNKLDMRNCVKFAHQPDLTNCPNIKEIYLDNTIVPGVDIADGAPVEVLHLPETITYLGLQNLTKLTDLQIASTANVTTLDIENIPQDVLDTKAILAAMPSGSIVKLIGVAFGSETEQLQMEEALNMLTSYYNKFRQPGGGAHPIIEGDLYVVNYSAADVEAVHTMFPDISIHGTLMLSVIFENQDEAILQTKYVYSGDSVTYSGLTPTMPPTETITYTFKGWNQDREATEIDPLYGKDVRTDRLLWAIYQEAVRKYKITWKNDGGTTLRTDEEEYQATPEYGSIPESEVYEEAQFAGWSPEITIVTADQVYTATYRDLSDAFLGFIKTAGKGTWSYIDNTLIDKTWGGPNNKECVIGYAGLPVKLEVKNYRGTTPVSSSYSRGKYLYCDSTTSHYYGEDKPFELWFDIPNYIGGLLTSSSNASYKWYVSNYENQVLDFLSLSPANNYVYDALLPLIQCDTMIIYTSYPCIKPYYDYLNTRADPYGPKKMYFPKATTYNSQTQWTQLPDTCEFADYGNATRIYRICNKQYSNMKTLILHSSSVVTYSNASSSYDLPNDATVYVPADLVESYRSTTLTNWCRMTAAGVTIAAITDEMEQAIATMQSNYTAYNAIVDDDYETQLTLRRAWLQQHDYPDFYWDIPLPSECTIESQYQRMRRWVDGNLTTADVNYTFAAASAIRYAGFTRVQGEENITQITIPSTFEGVFSDSDHDKALSGLNHVSYINIEPRDGTGDLSFDVDNFDTTTTEIGSLTYNFADTRTLSEFGKVRMGHVTEFPVKLFIGGVQYTQLVFNNDFWPMSSITNRSFGGFNTITDVVFSDIPTIKRVCMCLFEYNSALINVTIGGGWDFRSYGYQFRYCSSLQQVILTENVGNFSSDTFKGCTSLSTIYSYSTTPPSIYSSTLPGAAYVQHIYVPSDSVDAYKAATNWSVYADVIEAIP